LDDYIATKRKAAAAYAQALKSIPGITPMREACWAHSIFWMYTVLVDEAVYGTDSRSLMLYLREQGIQTRPLWQPLHLSSIYIEVPPTECLVAERLNRQALSLPSSVGITETEMERVVSALKLAREQHSQPPRNSR
jgi:perosamine synthetase